MTVAVLGSTGRLGRMLRAVWGADGARWLGREAFEPGGHRMLAGAESVLCLAGVVRGSGDLTLNSSLAEQTLDMAKAVGAGRVFLASSAAVYGTGPNFSEAAAVRPISCYGKSKYEMEVMAAEHEHPNTCLRIGNVAGADAILGNWRSGMTIDTFADGSTPRRSYMGPFTMARCLDMLFQLTDLPKMLNLTAPGSVEMGALLDAADLNWDRRPANEGTIARVELCTDRLASLVTFEAQDSSPDEIVRQWRRAVTPA